MISLSYNWFESSIALVTRHNSLSYKTFNPLVPGVSYMLHSFFLVL